MNFSQALELIKSGKKVRRKNFEEKTYLIGCYVGIHPQISGKDIPKTPENMSIVKMKGEYIHPKHHIFSDSFWIDIMAEDWEVME